MGHVDTYAAMSALFGNYTFEVPPSVDRAGELLGGVGGMWLDYGLVDWLAGKWLTSDMEIIAAIVDWETGNPARLSDPGLRATKHRDPRLGHIPAAQRMLFHERWQNKCPQCGVELEE